MYGSIESFYYIFKTNITVSVNYTEIKQINKEWNYILAQEF